MIDTVKKVLMWRPKERAKLQRGDLFSGTNKGKRGRRDKGGQIHGDGRKQLWAVNTECNMHLTCD